MTPDRAGLPPALARRLTAAGASAGDSPLIAWRRLRSAEGRRATVLDLYALAAAPRGLTAADLPLGERLKLAAAAIPEVWPGWQVTTDSDRRDLITVVDYDPDWPARFEAWRARLVDALGPVALRVEHVGSTSVPGLPAKPIIDVQLCVAELSAEERYVPTIEALGVQLRSRDELHRYFRPFPGRPRDVHVHVCAEGSDWEREHLLFRDYLRAHSSARQRYAEAKRAAAATWPDDGWAYTDAKGDVILDLLEAAQRWAAS